jgi:subfamily B ATP-binding cassette protein HlyB/CyaB
MDLSLLSSASIRRLVGLVQQETTIFNRSIRDNIALADPGATTEQVILAAKLAGAHDFIQELPGGYECQLYEQGSNLSGGQKQRIGIARALLSNPKVLILDEATSALDPDTEYLLCSLLPQIAASRTVIVISHRLSIVRSCDRIVVMDQGRVIEDGSHESLLDQRGLYARFHERQFGLMGSTVDTRPDRGMAV